MPNRHPKKKVEIVADAAALDAVLAAIEAAGARGYTVLPGAYGKGQRGIRAAHDIFDPARNALVVVIAPAAVAERVLDAAVKVLEARAGVAWISDVEVVRDDHF